MLRSFSVKNFKGFKDWVTLDLSKVKNYEFNPEGVKNGLINKALIYGYNCTGKSNLALAIMDIILHLTDQNKTINLYNNYLNADNSVSLAEFSYSFQFNESILEYKYGKSDFKTLVYESLSIDNNELIQYDRRVNHQLKIDLPGTKTLNKNLDQIKISVLKYIKSNAVLDESKNVLLLMDFFYFIDNMLLFWQLDTRGYQGYSFGNSDMLSEIIETNHFEDFKESLKKAGLDFNIDFELNNDKYTVYFLFENKKIDFWEIASTGMKSFTLFYYWLQQIQYEKNPPLFVIMDEFDAFYHSGLARFIVKKIKEINNCQFILTTHDTSIMTNELLRPDCYFLMYKGRIQSVAESTDKDLREAHNLEKMYRADVFNE